VTRVLDCACGTGRDLLMFHAMGLEVVGSDLSDAMLAQARENLGGVDIPLRKADYRQLPEHYDGEFDAVVCLSNSINEPLEDAETLHALQSMKAVLRNGGILVFDQGQTDASMRDPPRFAPVVNNRDFTRFFVIDYAGEIQTVHIFDFLHTEEETGFHQAPVSTFSGTGTARRIARRPAGDSSPLPTNRSKSFWCFLREPMEREGETC
jgi:SAM-dependent methyltransferase